MRCGGEGREGGSELPSAFGWRALYVAACAAAYMYAVGPSPCRIHWARLNNAFSAHFPLLLLAFSHNPSYAFLA